VGFPEEEDPDFFEKVERMVLKYFFYYPDDIGFSGHHHDLEAIELDIYLNMDAGCYQVRVETARGLVHGNRWYTNTLEITDDTRFPLTVSRKRGSMEALSTATRTATSPVAMM